MTTPTNTPRRTWAGVVLAALRSKGGALTLSYLYGYVEAQAPELVADTPRWREKVRRVLQRLWRQGLVKQAGRGICVALANLPVEQIETVEE